MTNQIDPHARDGLANGPLAAEPRVVIAHVLESAKRVQRVSGEISAFLAAQFEAGNVKILKGPWNKDFINEMVWFKGDDTGHDDQVDAVAGAYEDLVFGDEGPPEMHQAVVKGRGGRHSRRR